MQKIESEEMKKIYTTVDSFIELINRNNANVDNGITLNFTSSELKQVNVTQGMPNGGNDKSLIWEIPMHAAEQRHAQIIYNPDEDLTISVKMADESLHVYYAAFGKNGAIENTTAFLWSNQAPTPLW